jgi:hypothetical protein
VGHAIGQSDGRPGGLQPLIVQQRLGAVATFVGEVAAQAGRLHQVGIDRAGLLQGLAGLAALTERQAALSEEAPGDGRLRIEGEGLLERRDGLGVLSQSRQGLSEPQPEAAPDGSPQGKAIGRSMGR